MHVAERLSTRCVSSATVAAPVAAPVAGSVVAVNLTRLLRQMAQATNATIRPMTIKMAIVLPSTG
jgi:glycine cleavage system H lipoate-binding protein